ncbi:beta-ketoacyl-[acyl-carrier-protein] synthase family protein [Elusimicrobiota bacterium]
MSAEKNNMEDRIVVTGIGIVSPIGIGKDIFWDSLKNGKSGISEVSAFDTSQHQTHVGGEVKDFDPQKFPNNRRNKYFGRASQMALASAYLALEDSKIKKEELENINASVFMGTTMGEIQSMEKLDQEWIKSGESEINNFSVYQTFAYNISSSIALEFNLSGENRIYTTACSSGNYAIAYGCDLLKSGKTDLVFAGGSDAMSWISFTGFNKVNAAAPEKCQPFDKNRKGMIPAEGAAVLILETVERATKRGAKIYAEILGSGFSCDAHHMTQPNAEGITKCMSNALKSSRISPDEVDYICAHGTGTPLNDKAESLSIKNVFGDRKVPTSSIKSMIGHTMGAASAIAAAGCCLALGEGIMPPTINFEQADPECDIDCIPNEARKKDLNIVLNNGLAFGGNNASLVLKKY